jgi:branched-chain amino acid transport system substrate-binding protein
MEVKLRGISAAASIALLLVSACTSDDAETSDEGGGSTEETASSGGEASAEPIEISLVVDQTGVSAEIAAPTLAGIQSHIDHLNESGGVGGRPIEVQGVADSQSTAEGAQAAFQDVLQNSPQAVLGSINSLGIAAIPPIAAPAGIPVLIGSAPDSIMLPEPPPWLFTQVMPAAAMLEVSLDYLDDTLDGGLDGRRLAVTAAASGFGDGYAAAFEELAEERGYEVAIVDRHPLQMTSFATNAAQIVGSDAEALLLLDVPSQTPMIVNDLVAAGFEGPIVGYESASEPAIIEAVASDQYVTFRGAPVPAADGELAAAAEAAGQTERVNSLWFSYGWNQVATLAAAIESCDCEGPELLAAMQEITELDPEGDSTYGPLVFGPQKHYGTATVQFFTWDEAAGNEVETGELVTLSTD